MYYNKSYVNMFSFPRYVIILSPFHLKEALYRFSLACLKIRKVSSAKILNSVNTIQQHPLPYKLFIRMRLASNF